MHVERILDILLGGALAILAGLTVALIKEWRDRIKTRRVARNIIAVETIHNLFTLEYLETAITKVPGWSPTHQIRTAVLRQAVSPPIFASLTDVEQTSLLHGLGGLDHMEALRGSWEHQRVAPNHIMTVIAAVGQNLMNLLVFTCKLGSSHLVDKEAREIGERLKPIRAKDLKGGTPLIPRKTSLAIGDERIGPGTTLVCWEHDRPECPAKQVVVLKPRR